MKTILIICIVAAIGLVGFGAVHYMTTNVGNSPTSQVDSVAADALSVTISGEVNYPGAYVVAKAFNTDYAIENKGTYFIAPLYDNSNTCSASPIVKTNINMDDVETMQSIAGFTKTVANAIVSYRASAPFKAIEEIKNVSGVGAATYEKVKAKIVLRAA